MREKRHFDRTNAVEASKLLCDLRHVAMPADLIGAYTLVNLGEQELDVHAPARAGDARLCVDDDVGLDEPRRGDGREGKNRGSRIAARIGDQTRARNLVAVQFRQTVDGVLDV